MSWLNNHRPGYFGRRRDEKIAALNAIHGAGKWRLAWVVRESEEVKALAAHLAATRPPALFHEYGNPFSFGFEEACVLFYEQSYLRWLKDRPDDLRFICSYGECIDNAPTNVESGCDYTKQEAYSTHIQDIAVRNVLRHLGLKFEGPADKILVIRSADSNGFRFGPGNVPFAWPEHITKPSLCPRWATEGSVEDFWQSNKWVQVQGSEAV